jgi:ribosomal protein S18 acetylase RimI-like enzyme
VIFLLRRTRPCRAASGSFLVESVVPPADRFHAGGNNPVTVVPPLLHGFSPKFFLCQRHARAGFPDRTSVHRAQNLGLYPEQLSRQTKRLDTEVRCCMKVDYRLAEEDDLYPIHTALVESLNQFAAERALPLVEMDFDESLPLWRHLLGEGGKGFLVAEVKKRLAGFCSYILRDHLWFLSYLVVSPEFQGTGIGRELFERALSEARGNETAKVVAAYTNASNWPSVSLYTRNGIYPRMPVLKMEGSITNLCEPSKPVEPLAGQVVSLSEETVSLIDDIDLQIRGFRRDIDHRFWLGSRGMRCYVFGGKDGVSGYAYVSNDGSIGPLAALSADHIASMLCFCLDRLSSEGADQFSVHVPGENTVALALLYDRGFKIQDLSLVMSSVPFGKWENYIISRPSLL